MLQGKKRKRGVKKAVPGALKKIEDEGEVVQ